MSSSVRRSGAKAIGSAFSDLPDKNQAWSDLHLLALDEDSFIRMSAVEAMGSAFSELPDKNQAWLELYRLVKDHDNSVREAAVRALGMAFSGVPDKNQAWAKLHLLALDQNSLLRCAAGEAMGSAFSEMPDKNQAITDLCLLSRDKNNYVRKAAAEAIGSAFSELPNKDQAFLELFRLAKDQNSFVRSQANHSLGRASIQLAIESKNDEAFQEEIEKAIGFFEDASDFLFNPSRFCLPFYRSFYAITFKKSEAKSEVERYLKEARSATRGQKSKEILIEAIENLSKALLEVKRLEDSNLDLMKCDLLAYKQYCERVGELLSQTEEEAPGAVEVLRKGLPIIDRRIKDALNEIEENAAKFCRTARGTPLEAPGRNIFEQAKGIGAIELQDEAYLALDLLSAHLQGYCHLLPPEIREQLCKQLEHAGEGGPLEKGMAITSAFSAMATYAQDLKDNSEKMQKLLDYLLFQLTAKLNEIDFRVLRLSRLSSKVATDSYEMIALLKDMKVKLERLADLEPELDLLKRNLEGMSLSLHQNLQDKDHSINEIAQNLDLILNEMPNLPHKEFLEANIKEFKERKFWLITNRASALASIIGLFLTAYGMYRPSCP